MDKDTLFLWIQKTKAIFQLVLIYLPIMLFVFYTNGIFLDWIFDKSITFWYILLCIYVELIIIYFYYRCFIGIKKIFSNHKEFFLK